MSLSREVKNSNKKIELVLVLHRHLITQSLNPDAEKSVAFSQFKTMQVLTSDNDCKNAIILYEGCDQVIRPEGRNTQMTFILQEKVFPNYRSLNTIDFNSLTQDHLDVLFENTSVTLLYNLQLIDFIYPVTHIKDESVAKEEYKRAYQKNLANYPTLLSKACFRTEYSNELLLDCITMQDQLACKEFFKAVYKDNPAGFINREKRALDSVIKACSETNNKKAVLIFGRDHAEGIKNLIETQYNGQIELKKIIDTTIGCPVGCNIEWMQKINQEAMACQANKNYKDAIIHFENIAKFWYATPSSTSGRNEALLKTEFNLGTTLLLQSENDPSKMNEAVEHFKAAHDLAISSGQQKNNLYTQQYDEALSKLLSKQMKDNKQTLKFLLSDRIQSTNPWNVYKEAVQKYKNGEYHTAIVMLNQAYRQFKVTSIKNNPNQLLGKNSKECLLCQDTLIACYRQLKNYDKAIQCAEKTIGYYQKKQDINSVINKYHECLKSRYDDPKAVYVQAKVDYNEKRYTSALYKLIFVLESHFQGFTDGEKELCHSMLSACYQESKSYDLAKCHGDQALELRRKLYGPNDHRTTELEHQLVQLAEVLSLTTINTNVSNYTAK